MANLSVDIQDLLVNVNDLDDPTPRQLPKIFQHIVGCLNARELSYAVLGHIALARYERPRYVKDIEIVVRSRADEYRHATVLAEETRQRFAPYMDRRSRANAINLSLRPCLGPVEEGLLAEAVVCTWLGAEVRLASPEHLLWFWCRSRAFEHYVDAAALIQGGAVDLQRIQSLLREADDFEETAQERLRLAIGEAVLVSEFSFSRYMEERRARLNPDRIPVWRLRSQTNN